MSCAKSQIDILAALIHPRIGSGETPKFMMLEAYFDESGIHGGAETCVVGGYYGTQNAWRKFEREWNRVLSEYPELKEESFHAKRFFARNDGKMVGAYQGWDEPKANHFLGRLVQVILRNRIFPIGYGVIVNDFLTLPLRDRQWLTGAKFATNGNYIGSGCPDKPYYLPFQFCVLDSARMSRATAVNQIHFFAGLDRTFSGYASELYKFIRSDDRLQKSLLDPLGNIGFPLASKTAGLQAADLLTNRMYQHALVKLKVGLNLPMQTPLTHLVRHRKPNQRFTLFNRREIDAIQDAGRAAYAELVGTGKSILTLQIKRIADAYSSV